MKLHCSLRKKANPQEMSEFDYLPVYHTKQYMRKMKMVNEEIGIDGVQWWEILFMKIKLRLKSCVPNTGINSS